MLVFPSLLASQSAGYFEHGDALLRPGKRHQDEHFFATITTKKDGKSNNCKIEFVDGSVAGFGIDDIRCVVPVLYDFLIDIYSIKPYLKRDI